MIFTPARKILSLTAVFTLFAVLMVQALAATTVKDEPAYADSDLLAAETTPYPE